MNLTELEKLYDLVNIEGLSFVNQDGALMEDQMVLSPSASKVVAKTFFDIKQGLESAGRKCQPLILKFSKTQFVGISMPTGQLILQLNSKQPVDPVIEHALSVAQASKPKPQLPQLVVGSATTPQTPAAIGLPVKPVGTPVEEVPPELDEGLQLTWQDFLVSLTKALGRVAPSNLVGKIKDDAIEAAGLGPGETPKLEQISKVAEEAVKLVPNKGRRKMVQREVGIVLSNLGLI